AGRRKVTVPHGIVRRRQAHPWPNEFGRHAKDQAERGQAADHDQAEPGNPRSHVGTASRHETTEDVQDRDAVRTTRPTSKQMRRNRSELPQTALASSIVDTFENCLREFRATSAV